MAISSRPENDRNLPKGAASVIGGMPPPWRNHRDPPGADTPTATAASSLPIRVAIRRQKSCSHAWGDTDARATSSLASPPDTKPAVDEPSNTSM
jgi:hypothetical protein